MSSREEGAPVCKAHPVPMTTLSSEMAYPALPLSGFLPNCASVYLPELEIRLTSSCVGEIDK